MELRQGGQDRGPIQKGLDALPESIQEGDMFEGICNPKQGNKFFLFYQRPERLQALDRLRERLNQGRSTS